MIKSYLIIIALTKILSQCHWKCKTCDNPPIDQDHHECISCIDNANFMVNSNNCYFVHELPGLYFNSNTDQYEFCSSSDNCYECYGSPTLCKSCKKGYEYNENLNKCEQCNFSNYIYVLDGVENCQDGEKSVFTCKLKHTKCTNININTENYECPRDYPLFALDQNNIKNCLMDVYVQNNLTISNKIIKTQWLNKIIKIGENNCWYITGDFSSQGDLILETNTYEYDTINKKRYFYGIKSNGRPFFYNNEDHKFNELKTIEANTDNKKFESRLIKLKLVNDVKDYFLIMMMIFVNKKQ